MQLEKTDEAIALNKDDIERVRLKKGQKHGMTIGAMKFLAKTFEEIGKKEQATSLREEIDKLEEID